MLTPGTKLGHFEILALIGAGGMGEVYRARDLHLERDADESARKRFRKEALALSKLNHPNIATVHDFDTQQGVDFLVMEYVAGTSLAEKLAAGPLPEKEVARLGQQLADGLAAAHEQNVVHRDLKPSNLRLTPDARLKILDFGLAKLLRPAPDEAVTADSLTESHLGVAGTLPYMSPEQLRGEPVDARTDIYAAGCVLYELATGHRPFQEKLSTTLTDAILHQPAPPPARLQPSLSPELERIILKCLEKDPENRYQSAKELLVDLRRLAAPSVPTYAPSRAAPAAGIPVSRRQAILRWGTVGLGALLAVLALLLALNPGGLRQRLFGTPPPKIQSLAVLPLENLSRDPEQDYFADGMTDALTAELSKISALKVISRTSAMQYKGAKKPAPQIARELDVDALLEGSVLREADQVRITVQLIHGPTDQHLWADSYQRELRSILALQSDVARAVSQQIQITLTPQEQSRLAVSRPVNPDAYEAYLRGRYWASRFAPDAIPKSLDYFQRALALDPAYAPAYAGLAEAYTTMAFASVSPPRDVYPKARAAAERALELDDTLAEAHLSVGWIQVVYDWNWSGAETSFRRALELSPNSPMAHSFYSILLSVLGRHDEAIAEARRARELDPLSPLTNINLGWRFHNAGRFQQALEQYQHTLELEPNFLAARQNLAAIYTAQGRYQEAQAELSQLEPLFSQAPILLAELGRTYALSGKKAEALRLAQRLETLSQQRYLQSYWLAALFAALGDPDRAFARLEEAYVQRDGWLIFLNVDQRFESLRSDPRFPALL
ncbi:MAG: protein kinase, partial [Acidobacteria bacterium]|nr:protein kinase [Acidobacteriota bacterium]